MRGATHLVLDDQGLITLHRDYWDAAEELYEKLPAAGRADALAQAARAGLRQR